MKKIESIKDYVYRDGEYLIGSEATGSHACYFIYGVLRKGEERKMSPGRGHEEILVCIEGKIEIEDNRDSLSKGQAIHLKDEETLTLKGLEEISIYVIAGGHSDSSHHHHA